MTKQYSFLWIVLALVVLGCSPTFVTTYDAHLDTYYNRGYRQGNKAGFENAQRLWFKRWEKQAIEKGRIEGIQIGRLKGYEEFKAEYEELSTTESKIIQITEYKEHDEKIRSFNVYKNKVIEEGMKEVNHEQYLRGYKDGYHTAFDSLYNLALRRGEYVKFSRTGKAKLYIDYERIAKLLHFFEGRNAQFIEKHDFGEIIRTIYTDVLIHLVSKFDLSINEQNEVFQRYQEIHPGLVDLTYQRFLDLCATKDRNYSASFYDYRYSSSTSMFLFVINANVCSVADACFTYAKGNTQFATENGFKVLGRVCDLIQEEFIIPFQDYLSKTTLRLEYEAALPYFHSSTKELLVARPAVTETYSKTVKDNVKLRNGLTVDIKMEITTQLQLGYDTSSLEINLDHKKQQILIYLTKEPIILKVLKQDYKVLNVRSRMHWSWKRFGFHKRVSVGNKDFKRIFNNYKAEAETEAKNEIQLSPNSMQAIIPLLTKAMEPAVMLDYSCYEVKYSYEGREHKIIKTNCK